MDNYISRLDEIDKWLFDSFGILPGCGCSQENLRHTTARMVAEVLWPKQDLALTWEDVAYIVDTFYAVEGNTKEKCEEVLRRFNEYKKLV